MATIVAVGRAKFNACSSATVTFPKPVTSDYYVIVTGDGGSGGAMGRANDTFHVTRRTPQGFVIQSGSSTCRQVVDYVVVT